MEGRESMTEGALAPGDTLHGYLLTWIADHGTESYGLQYDPSDPGSQESRWRLHDQDPALVGFCAGPPDISQRQC